MEDLKNFFVHNLGSYIVFFLFILLCLIPIIINIIHAGKLKKMLDSGKYSKQLVRYDLHKKAIFMSKGKNERKILLFIICFLILIIVTIILLIKFHPPEIVYRIVPIVLIGIFLIIMFSFKQNNELGNLIKKYTYSQNINCELITETDEYDNYNEFFDTEPNTNTKLRFKGYFRDYKCKYLFYSVEKRIQFNGSNITLDNKNYIVYDYDFSSTDIYPIRDLIANKIKKTYKGHTHLVKCYAKENHIIIVKETVPWHYNAEACKDDIDDVLLFYQSIVVLLDQPDQLC